MSPWGPWCETTGNPRKMPPGARGCCALWGRGARPAPGGRSCTEGLCAPDACEGQANLKKSRRKREPGLVEGDGASRRLERQPRSGTSLSVNRTAANARLSKDAGKRGARAAGTGRDGVRGLTPVLPGSWRKSASREGARRTGERPDRGIRGRRTCTHDSRKGFRLNGHQSRPAWPRAAGTVSTDASDPEPRPLGRILGAHPAGGQGLAPTARRAARRRESRTCTHACTHARTHIHSRAHTRTCTRTHAHTCHQGDGA